MLRYLLIVNNVAKMLTKFLGEESGEFFFSLYLCISNYLQIYHKNRNTNVWIRNKRFYGEFE